MPHQPLLPTPDSDSLPFWEACREGVLQFQVCTRCSALRHPPRGVCAGCGSADFRWKPVSGKGTVYSFVIYRRAFHASLQDDLPYAVALIDLNEGLRIVSRLVDSPMEEIFIGMPVEVRFVQVGGESVLPFFSAVG